MRKTELTKSMLDNMTLSNALRRKGAFNGFVRLLRASTLLVVMLSWASSVSAQCTLSCNGSAQVSLPGPAEGCEALVGHPMILTNSFLVCPGAKKVTVYDGAGLALPSRSYTDGLNTHTGSVVDETYEGQTLTVEVRDITTGNECWGTIKVEDKLGPQFTNCTDTTLFCIQDSRPDIDTVGGIMGGEVIAPTVDDCMGASNLIVSYVDQVTNGTCTDMFSSRIRRTWTATDSHGNVTTCVQVITLLRVSLEDVTPICPNQVTVDCKDPNDFPSTEPDSLPVGAMFPLINVGGADIPVRPGASAFCSLAASYSDEEFGLCGVGKKILRTWTIYDWCVDIGPGNPWSCIQVIKFEDKTAPTIVGGCGGPIVANTDAHDCDGDVAVPAIVIEDCSDVTVIVNSNFGVLNSNGGVIENVPAGQHLFTYIATDDCGNSATCSKIVNVEDMVPPVAVCDEFTVVSLTSDGTGKVYATTFNDGSSDNCDLDRFEVRRMSSACQRTTAFDEYAWFDCCDLGDTVMVNMRVYDKNDNYNECMVEVWVQDKLPPKVTCPPDKTVDCSEDLIDLSRFGMATAVDNCDSIAIVEDIRRGTDNCGVGVIRRIFTGTDSDGREGSCTQRITVRNNDLFEEDDIEWPLNYTTKQCMPSLDPDDIPCDRRNYCRPLLEDSSCGLLAVTYTDQELAINNSCKKILRSWVIVDWCQYDPNDSDPVGYWSWVQTIKVLDEVAPVIDCPADTITIEHFDADCMDIPVTMAPFTATDCSTDLDYEIRIDYDNNGSVDSIMRGNDASGLYQGGLHRLLVVVSDGCGNTGTCEVYLEIIDRKKPTAVCFNGLSATLMPDGLGGGMVTLTPMMFNNKSFDNCTPADDLKLEVIPADFTCDDLGMQMVRMEVTDEAGNTDWCETFVDIQDNMGACSGTSRPASIGGVIKDQTGNGVQGVQIDLNNATGSMLSSSTTTSDGTYMFPNLQAGADYSVTPVLNEDAVNGVTTFDLLLISRHILNVEKLNSPYKIIAADANRTGNISTLDLIDIRKIILRTKDEFTNNTSWRFVDKNYVFANPQAPLQEQFAEVMNYNNLAGDMDVSDFTAIKVGDVNDDAKPNNVLGVDGRTFNGTVTIAVEDLAFEAGQTLAVPFTAEDFQEIVGYQFTLNFDETALTLADIEMNEELGLSKANFGLSMTDKGIITTSWDNSKTTLNSYGTDVLFTLHFQTNAAGTLSEAINLNSQYTAAEAYASLDTNSPDIKDVTLRFNDSTVGADFELFQNNPNPFSRLTTIGFQLPEAAQATLTVFDLAGKILKVYNGEFTKGYNQIRVSNSDIPATGVLYYRLESANHTATKKMILLK